jgi:hypothetical protein
MHRSRGALVIYHTFSKVKNKEKKKLFFFFSRLTFFFSARKRKKKSLAIVIDIFSWLHPFVKKSTKRENFDGNIKKVKKENRKNYPTLV